MAKRLLTVAAAAVLCLGAMDAHAKGGGHSSSGHSSTRSSSHSSSSSHASSRTSGSSHVAKGTSPGPGTGSKSQSVTVRSYTKKDGTHVAAAKRTTADGNYRNNYSTKGNTNVATGKAGTRIEPPKKKPR
jgi:hypothetical protein